MKKAYGKFRFDFGLLILSSLIITVVLIGSGAILSGYHLVDDHTVITLADSIAFYGWRTSLECALRDDLTIRFRPLYVILNLIKTQIFGINMNAWMFVDYVECLVTFSLLYIFCRLLGGSRLDGILFSGLSLFGKQITPWYRALNQENEGMLLLSIVLFLTAWGYVGDSKLYKWKWYRVVLIFTVLLCSLMKEAFVLVIPCFVFLVLYLSHRWELENRGGESRGEGLFLLLLQDMKRNWDYILSLSTIFVIELYVIVFCVGIDYGISKSDRLRSIFAGVIEIIVHSGARRYFVLGGLGLLCFLKVNSDIRVRLCIEKYFWMIFFVLYGVSAQMFLHAKSSMWERYLFPFVVIINVAIIFFLKIVKKERVIYIFYMLICVVFLCKGIKDSWDGARRWGKWGGDIEAAFEIVYSKISYDRPDRILVSMGAEEYNWAVKQWLWHYCGYELAIDITEDMDLEEKYDFLIMGAGNWDNEYLKSYEMEISDFDAEIVNDTFVIATMKGGASK